MHCVILCASQTDWGHQTLWQRADRNKVVNRELYMLRATTVNLLYEQEQNVISLSIFMSKQVTDTCICKD